MKRIDTRTMIAVGITLAMVAGVAIYFGWKVGQLQNTGWAGFAYFYQPHRDRIVEQMPILAVLVKPDGEVNLLQPGGPADIQGLRLGDRIVSVGGIPLENLEELDRFAAAVRPGQEIVYEVRRGDESRMIPIRMARMSKSQSQVISWVASLTTGFGFLLVSILLFTAGPRSPGSLLFFQLCVVGSLFFFFSAAFEFEISSSQGVVPLGSQADTVLTLLVYLVLATIMSNLLLHFSLQFPRRSRLLERQPKMAWWLHLGPFALPIAVAAGLLIISLSSRRYQWLIMTSAIAISIAIALILRRRHARNGPWTQVAAESPFLSLLTLSVAVIVIWTGSMMIGGERVFLLSFMLIYLTAFAGFFLWSIVYLFLTVANFYRSYRSSNTEERRQLRWPLWGMMVSLLFISVLAVVVVGGFFTSTPLYMKHPVLAASLGALVKLGYLIMPISIGLGIQKYKLMQIDTILKRTFVYASVTAAIVIIYLVVVGVAGLTLVSLAGVENQIVTVAATLVVAALFVPLRNRVQTFVDARFFRRESSYEDVRRSLARVTATSRDLGEFLDKAATSLRDALGVGHIALYTREPSGSALVLQKLHGVGSHSPMTEIRAEHEIARPGDRIVDLGIGDGESDPATARYAVRLQTAEGVVGAIVVPERARDALSEEDLDFLAAISDQLALGISSLQIRTDDLELVQARQIQRSLLPSHIPQIRGVNIATAWIPARSVGGDYYDVLALSSSKLGFCIGDVVGKGMPAALLMSGLQSAVRAIAPADASTDVTVAGIRRVATQNLTGGKFITFFYGTIDSSRRIVYTNAGHNEPIVARADGTVERLASNGAAIARLMSDAQLSTSEIEIGRGDTVVLFTDGVSEAPAAGSDGMGDAYGEDRLAALVSEHRSLEPDDLIGTIVDDVRQFAGGEFADDLTLVVIQAV